jgi:hypothetical protein
MVAYEQYLSNTGPPEGDEYNTEWSVVVRDLRTGRVEHEVPTGTQATPNPHHVGVGPVTAIVVKADGAVAWIAEGEDGPEVHALDKTGSRVLATGEDIKPHALGLKGSELYWSQGGKWMTASLN